MHLLTFSGHSDEALRMVVRSHETYAQSHPEHLVDLSYTLNVRREALAHRAFAVVSKGSLGEPFQFSQFKKVNRQMSPIFVFPGQGAQCAEMGADLLREDVDFQKSVEAMQSILELRTAVVQSMLRTQ